VARCRDFDFHMEISGHAVASMRGCGRPEQIVEQLVRDELRKHVMAEYRTKSWQDQAEVEWKWKSMYVEAPKIPQILTDYLNEKKGKISMPTNWEVQEREDQIIEAAERTLRIAEEKLKEAKRAKKDREKRDEAAAQRRKDEEENRRIAIEALRFIAQDGNAAKTDPQAVASAAEKLLQYS
jgi:hypothetical protein